jgi:uncharacterized membrane protein (DUF4010 family)
MLLRSPRQKATSEEVKLSNPFELSSALKFALFYAAVLLGARAATHYFSTGGTYLAGLLSGTTDVDAITLSMARLSLAGEVPEKVATTTILLASYSNTVVKAGLAVAVGGWAFGRRVLVAYGAMIGAGVLGLLWVRLAG